MIGPELGTPRVRFENELPSTGALASRHALQWAHWLTRCVLRSQSFPNGKCWVSVAERAMLPLCACPMGNGAVGTHSPCLA